MGNIERKRFLQIATGSASELEYQFVRAREPKLLDEERYELLSDEVVEVKRVLASLIQRLRSDASNERAGD